MNELELLRHPRAVTRGIIMDEPREGTAPLLQQHGCTVISTAERLELILPVGSTQAEILPRLQSARYTVTLPDGYTFVEVLGRDGVSALYLPASDVTSIPSEP